MMHAHWFVATAQLFVGIVWSVIMWATGLRKTPNLTAGDIAACIPIGLFASLAHSGSVLASAVGAVSFAQIVKACEPVFAAVVGLLIPPMDVKPILAYAMLIPIVGGVGLACIKEGKGVDINVQAFLFASMANAAAALKGKLGSSVTKSLKSDSSKNMDEANVYAVMNIISFACSVPFVVVQELPTLSKEWNHAVEVNGLYPLLSNLILSGFMFYIYNEFGKIFVRMIAHVCVWNIDSNISCFAKSLCFHKPRRCCHLVCVEHCQASHHHCSILHCLPRGHGTQHCYRIRRCDYGNICLLACFAQASPKTKERISIS